MGGERDVKMTKQGIILRHPKLSHADLASLMRERVGDAQKAWYLVAHITDTAFGTFDGAKAEDLVSEWTQGSVFCHTCEIRWKRMPGAEHNDVLVLCEDTTLQLEGFQPIGDRWQVILPGEQAMLMAWGSPTNSNAPHIRMESRLPKRLCYPVECKNGRLHCLYYCAPSGEVQFLRLTGVK